MDAWLRGYVQQISHIFLFESIGGSTTNGAACWCQASFVPALVRFQSLPLPPPAPYPCPLHLHLPLRFLFFHSYRFPQPSLLMRRMHAKPTIQTLLSHPAPRTHNIRPNIALSPRPRPTRHRRVITCITSDIYP